MLCSNVAALLSLAHSPGTLMTSEVSVLSEYTEMVIMPHLLVYCRELVSQAPSEAAACGPFEQDGSPGPNASAWAGPQGRAGVRAPPGAHQVGDAPASLSSSRNHITSCTGHTSQATGGHGGVVPAVCPLPTPSPLGTRKTEARADLEAAGSYRI